MLYRGAPASPRTGLPVYPHHPRDQFVLPVIYLLVVFALALAVWACLIMPRTPAVYLVAAVLPVGTFFGPAYFALPGPMQISADRLLLAAVCVYIAIGFVGRRVVLPRLETADVLVAAMSLWFLASTLTGGEPVKGVNPLGTWLFYIFLPACVYALVRVSSPGPEEMRRIATIAIAAGIYLSLLGIFETRGWYALVYPAYIGDTQQWEFLGRARGPLLNPSANGILLTAALALAAVRLQQSGRAGKLLYALVIGLLFVGIYCTLTRSVWIGAGLCLAAVFWNEVPRWTKVLGFAALLLLSVMAAAGLKDQLLQMKRDKNLSAAEAEKSVRLRPLLAVVAIEMVKDSPLVGHGFGNYQKNSRPYFSDRRQGLPLEQARGYFQHNVILSAAADTGLVGAGLLIAVVLTFISSARQLSSGGVEEPLRLIGLGTVGMIVGYGVGGMFQDVLVMPMIQMYLLFFGGLAVTLRRQVADATERRGIAADCPQRVVYPAGGAVAIHRA